MQNFTFKWGKWTSKILFSSILTTLDMFKHVFEQFCYILTFTCQMQNFTFPQKTGPVFFFIILTTLDMFKHVFEKFCNICSFKNLLAHC